MQEAASSRSAGEAMQLGSHEEPPEMLSSRSSADIESPRRRVSMEVLNDITGAPPPPPPPPPNDPLASSVNHLDEENPPNRSRKQSIVPQWLKRAMRPTVAMTSDQQRQDLLNDLEDTLLVSRYTSSGNTAGGADGDAEPDWLTRAYSSVVMDHGNADADTVARRRRRTTALPRRQVGGGDLSSSTTDDDEDGEPDWLSAASTAMRTGVRRARKSVVALAHVFVPPPPPAAPDADETGHQVQHDDHDGTKRVSFSPSLDAGNPATAAAAAAGEEELEKKKKKLRRKTAMGGGAAHAKLNSAPSRKASSGFVVPTFVLVGVVSLLLGLILYLSVRQQQRQAAALAPLASGTTSRRSDDSVQMVPLDEFARGAVHAVANRRAAVAAVFLSSLISTSAPQMAPLLLGSLRALLARRGVPAAAAATTAAVASAIPPAKSPVPAAAVLAIAARAARRLLAPKALPAVRTYKALVLSLTDRLGGRKELMVRLWPVAVR